MPPQCLKLQDADDGRRYRNLAKRPSATDTRAGDGSLPKGARRLGDRRPLDTILRGIQRMASGETRVSGEMLVILEMMNRERQRARYEASVLPWVTVANGCVTTKTRDFTISLSPQSRGRWLVNLVHVDGYSPPWPAWQSNLDEAKIKSLLCLDDALADLQYHRQWAAA